MIMGRLSAQRRRQCTVGTAVVCLTIVAMYFQFLQPIQTTRRTPLPKEIPRHPVKPENATRKPLAELLYSDPENATRKPVAELLYSDPENVPAFFRSDYLELYTRLTYSKTWNETTTALFPSMQLFWPHMSIAVCFDADSPLDQKIAPQITKLIAERFPPVKARGVLIKDYPYLVAARSTILYTGYQRGQLDMMFADKVVKAKYVGLCDTDTMFVTLVTPQAIFSADGKPKIRGLISRNAPQVYSPTPWEPAAKSTAYMLKKDFVMSCMSYFPVIMATAHIKELREYVEKIHGKPFLHVYKEIVAMVGNAYCHYSIMCSYVFYFHRDEYEFHYQGYSRYLPGWDAPRPYEVKDFSFMNEENKRPIIAPTVHFTYTRLEDNFTTITTLQMLQHGFVGHLRNRYAPEISSPMLVNSFCYVCLAQCRKAEECTAFKNACSSIGVAEDKLQVLLFRFELWMSWEWEPRVLSAQKEYYKTLKNYTYWIPYGKQIVSKYHHREYAKLKL